MYPAGFGSSKYLEASQFSCFQDSQVPKFSEESVNLRSVIIIIFLDCYGILIVRCVQLLAPQWYQYGLRSQLGRSFAVAQVPNFNAKTPFRY